MEERQRLTGEELDQAFQEGLKYLEVLVEKEELEIVLDSGKVGKVLVVHAPERNITDFRVHLKFPTREEDYRIDPNKGLTWIYILEKDVIHTTILRDLSPSEEFSVGSGWRDGGRMEFKTVWRPRSPGYQKFIEGQRLLALEVVDWLKAGIKQL